MISDKNFRCETKKTRMRLPAIQFRVENSPAALWTVGGSWRTQLSFNADFMCNYQQVQHILSSAPPQGFHLSHSGTAIGSQDRNSCWWLCPVKDNHTFSTVTRFSPARLAPFSFVNNTAATLRAVMVTLEGMRWLVWGNDARCLVLTGDLYATRWSLLWGHGAGTQLLTKCHHLATCCSLCFRINWPFILLWLKKNKHKNTHP